MTDDTMLARLARALEAAQMKWKAENGGDAASCVDCPNEVLVLAVLAELREPTLEMRDAGADAAASYDSRYEHPRDAAGRVWEDIIDHILSERHPGGKEGG